MERSERANRTTPNSFSSGVYRGFTDTRRITRSLGLLVFSSMAVGIPPTPTLPIHVSLSRAFLAAISLLLPPLAFFAVHGRRGSFSHCQRLSLRLSLFFALSGPSSAACSSSSPTSRCPFHRNSPFLRSSRLPRAFQTSPSSPVSERWWMQGKRLSPPWPVLFTFSLLPFSSPFRRLDFSTPRLSRPIFVCFSSGSRPLHRSVRSSSLSTLSGMFVVVLPRVALFPFDRFRSFA